MELVGDKRVILLPKIVAAQGGRMAFKKRAFLAFECGFVLLLSSRDEQAQVRGPILCT
jgi:hypothetical protein